MKNKTLDALIALIVISLLIVVSCSVIYGYYWLAKHLSYSFLYEDMVVRTIHQQVKIECLKHD